MAAGIVLKFTYDDNEGKTTSFSLKYANDSPDQAEVVAVGQSFITNNSIFENTYTTLKSAKIITTTETEYIE